MNEPLAIADFPQFSKQMGHEGQWLLIDPQGRVYCGPDPIPLAVRVAPQQSLDFMA